MVKRRLIPPGAVPQKMLTDADHHEALVNLLRGRKPPVRGRLISDYIAAQAPGAARKLAKEIAAQIDESMSKRGRPPRDDVARTASQRTIESRRVYKEQVAHALTWLLAKMTLSEQRQWAAQFPSVAKRGIKEMPTSFRAGKANEEAGNSQGRAGEPAQEETGMLPVSDADFEGLDEELAEFEGAAFFEPSTG